MGTKPQWELTFATLEQLRVAMSLTSSPIKRVVVFGLQSHQSNLVNLAARKILIGAEMLAGVKKGSKEPIYLPTEVKRWTLLKSPFKHKRAQDAWERITHKRMEECFRLQITQSPSIDLKLQRL